MKHNINTRKPGFTIVELLLVIVTIAILAALLVAVYNGIQSRSHRSALVSDVGQASRLLQLYKASNDSYPSDHAQVNQGKGLPSSGGMTTWQYTSDGATYCLTGSRNYPDTKSFYITNTGEIQEGACAGHVDSAQPPVAANWTEGTLPVSAVRGLTYGDGMFVAVGGTVSSTDGVNWISRSSTTPSGAGLYNWRAVAYGAGTYVTVALSNKVMTSANGISWTLADMPNHSSGSNSWYSVTYGNGMFVAAGTGGIMTSSDGISWTERMSGYAFRSVIYAAGMFVAAGTNGIATSTDGISWTPRSGTSSSWKSVTYGNGMFVAVRDSSTSRIITSTNGTSWTLRPAPEDNSWQSVTYGKGHYVAVASSGTNRVMTSTDGINWTLRPGVSRTWSQVVFGANKFVAVSDSGGYFMIAE